MAGERAGGNGRAPTENVSFVNVLRPDTRFVEGIKLLVVRIYLDLQVKMEISVKPVNSL